MKVENSVRCIFVSSIKEIWKCSSPYFRIAAYNENEKFIGLKNFIHLKMDIMLQLAEMDENILIMI